MTEAKSVSGSTAPAWKKAISEITGARKSEYEESRKRMGITREVASLQTTPQGDFVVVCLEADEPDSVVARYLTSNAPFDRWFAETVLKGTHGMDASQGAPPPNQVYLDWRA